MEFRALGTIAVVNGNETIALSDLERVVLGALLLDAGEAVSAATLADALWGDAEPPSARKSLQMHVSRLRQKLGTATIETCERGYRLVAESGSIDVGRFIADPAGNVELWRGRPYDDLGEWPPAVAARAFLERQHADADDARATQRVQAGTATVAGLEALVRAAPDREHRWVLLMRVLYRSGEQAAALRAFARARTVLREGYGVEPGPELVALQRAILDHDPLLLATDDHLRRARALRAQGQPDRALEAFEAALALADDAGADPRSAIDIACEVAECARLLGHPDRAVAVLTNAAERARLVEDASRLATVALVAAGDGWITTLDPNSPMIMLLDEAVKLLGDSLTPLRARVLARRAIAESHTRLEAARDDAERALTLGRLLRDPNAIAAALLATLVVDQDLTTLADRQRRAVELVTLAAANDTWRWEAWALPHLARVAAIRGDMPRAFEHLATLARLAATEVEPVAAYHASANEVLRATLDFDLDRSLAAADRQRDAALHAFMEPTAAAVADFGTTGMVRIAHRQYEALRNLPDVTFPYPTMQATWVVSKALVHAGNGDLEAARTTLTALAPAELPALAHDLYWPNLMWMHAELARRLGDRDRAAVTIELLDPFAELHVLDGAGIYHGAFAHHLGIAHAAAGDVDAAGDAFRAAVDAHHGAGRAGVGGEIRAGARRPDR